LVRILLFLMKSVVALLATLGLLLVAAAVGGWLFWQEVDDWRSARYADPLPERIVLELDLAQGLRDGPAEGPLALAGLDSTPGLAELLEALEVASRDERVAGIALRLGYGQLSTAQVQELRAALLRFRDSGRFALGFAESFGEAGDGNEHYHLATALDAVWLQPSGDLDLIGYRLEQPFLRELLDDWDLTPRFDQRQQWKGLADIALREALSQPVRENLQAVADSLLAQLVEAVAEGRGLEPTAARRVVDRGPYTAERALQAGLVDRLAYRDAFETELRKRAGDDAETLAPLDYLDRHEAAELPEDTPRIALLHLQGPIMLGSGGDGLTGSPAAGAEALAATLREAADDPAVRALVLRIDSPGGSAVASDMLWREVGRVVEGGKPVIVSLGSVAASGGYYVAVAGSRILAQPGSLTGSIGVAGGKLVLERFWPHLGVAWDGVQAGANADVWSLNRDFSPAQWRRFQESLDRTYAQFTAKVAEGRGLEGERLEAATGGRVFTGADALQAGLVDALGGLPEAVQAAREEAGLPPEAVVALVEYPERDRALRRLFDRFLRGGIEGGPAELRVALTLLPLLERAAPLLHAAERLQADPRSRVLEAPAMVGR